MGYWAEVRNDFFEGVGEIDQAREGDVLATIAIDAWKTADDNEEGCVIACVMLSKHGDILVDYIDNIARSDQEAQRVISEAKVVLMDYYTEIQKNGPLQASEREAKDKEPLGNDMVSLWGRLGISLDVTSDELSVLKSTNYKEAQELLVELILSDRCKMSGDTYFPEEANEEYIADMEEDLAFDLSERPMHDGYLKQHGIDRTVPGLDSLIKGAEKQTGEQREGKTAPAPGIDR